MEDLEQPGGSPSLDGGPEEPQGNDDPRDTLRPEVEEENGGVVTPPIADPMADMETQDDDEHPLTANGDGANGTGEGEGEGEGDTEDPNNTGTAVEDDDDMESDLEELDDKEFENFDPSALNLPAEPLQVDESNVAMLGVHKRKRTAEEEAERERKKKKKEKKRDKPKRSRRGADTEDDFEGGPQIDGKRRSGKTKSRAKTPDAVDEEQLSPEERRRRALERKMDEALKTNRVSRRKAAQAAEERADEEIESVRRKIIHACQADQEARGAEGGAATNKIAILPEVIELMNRNTIQSQLVDPEINILEALRFMLEPADQDGALPNYRIQRELLDILSKLNISKEALISSGIGKVVLFYTKSIQPQPEIKRKAEKLVSEWMRIVLNKGKDRRNMPVETKMYDPLVAQSQRPAASQNSQAALAEKRRKALAAPGPTNRARVEGGVGTYTVAPVSNLSNAQGVSARRLGASGDDAFRKITARSTGKGGGRR